MDDKVLAKVPGGGQQNRAGRHVLREGQGYWTVLSGKVKRQQSYSLQLPEEERQREVLGSAPGNQWQEGEWHRAASGGSDWALGNVSSPRGVETLKRLSRELPREVVGAPCLLVFKELGQYTQ